MNLINGERLKKLRTDADLTMEELATKLNNKYGSRITKSMISRWEHNLAMPRNPYLSMYAYFFNIDMNYLIGKTDIQNPLPTSNSTQGIRINVYGTIPAGIPIEAITEIEDWEEIPAAWAKGGNEFFALLVNGDSMYPKYLSGDVVILRKQANCECGDECAVYVNGYDATLKKIKKNEDGSVTLQPLNPNYAPQTYGINDEEVNIVGKVVEIRRKV